MKSIKAMQALRVSSRSSVTTGVHCPRTGWWIPETQSGHSPRYIWQGSIMPGTNGRNVQWQLAKEDPAGNFALTLAGTPDLQRSAAPADAAGALWPDCSD
jgi:hypothetical protein